MSRARRAGRARNLALDISPVALALLRDEPITAEKGSDEDIERFCLEAGIGEVTLEELWRRHKDAVLAAWVEERPGSRPSCWWRWDAKEGRRKVGGAGEARYLRYEPGKYRSLKGMPTEYLLGTLDPADWPRFESQAHYLRRLDLLLPGEAKRLTAEDFLAEDVLGLDWEFEQHQRLAA
jgi:hypothetical protein